MLTRPECIVSVLELVDGVGVCHCNWQGLPLVDYLIGECVCPSYTFGGGLAGQSSCMTSDNSGGSGDVFLKKNTLDFKPTDSQLEVNIESLEIHFYRTSITGKFLYKKIFKNTKSIFMSGYVKHISLEAFKYLESVKLINLEYDIFKSTGVKCLQSLNLKFKNNSIFLPNHTIQICFGVYYFPDEDFCLFKDFPANQLLLVVPFSPNSNCSCLLFWLLDSYFYDHGFKFLENNSYCLNLEKMEKKHKILVDYIYESEVIVLLTVYLIPVIGILSIVLNSCNIVVVLKIQNDKEKNLKEIKKSFYQWILLNSSIYILYSMISLFHPISICIFQNGIYCPFFSRSIAIQYYEIYVYDFFGGILKTLSNFLSINVAFQRYLNLVSNKKNFFSKISYKNLFLIIFCSAFLINIDKILTSEVNRDKFDIDNSEVYPEFPYRNTFKGIFDADSPHQDRNHDIPLIDAYNRQDQKRTEKYSYNEIAEHCKPFTTVKSNL
ncbi:hypothetical protein BpHYR1_054069 [Brachionus plicatilis]|uniref:Uncharacterized protein n=1 Tax=Brachionus plicatilis TaxID=10195 RepID=A0A3M7QYJ6_BRAPC|nr:hypothetical protein BpHYR1_054069 [Brachionus plicatilis]